MVSTLTHSRGFSLFLQQFSSLFVKNAILAWRNRTATALQLGASFFFIFLIWCVNEAIQAAQNNTTTFKNLAVPDIVSVPQIPTCESGYFIKSPCYDLLWSGNGSAIITSLVANLTANNPGRPIPSSKVLGFATPDDVDAWLLQNPYRSTGALHFRITDAGLGYGLQTNSTAKSYRGRYENPTLKFQTTMQVAAERELARYLAQDWSLEWAPAYSEYAHPAVSTFSAVGSVGPTFLLAAAMFGFVIQMGNLVLERELKLRQAMSTMGLLDSAYWLTWLVWEEALAIISSVLLVLFGMIFQFDFFIKNAFPVVFFVFFLFQSSMVGFAFMLSTFLKKSASATTAGFLIFIFGFLGQLIVIFGFPYDKSISKGIQAAYSLFPPNLLAIALQYLGDATATNTDKGIKWSAIGKCAEQDPDCQLTMAQIFSWLLALTVVYFLLALYFDNIFPDVNGVRKPCFFFLYPSFWCGGIRVRGGGGGCKCIGSVPDLPPLEGPEDADVATEKDMLQGHTEAQDGVAIEVRGLVKSFAGSTEIGCCKCKRNSAFHAIKGSWLKVEKDTLFCLLGPNGAGKSTTINCLTGIIPTTSGDARIYGNSIRIASDMNRIRSFMGVCPQFDILWSAMTGREHLRLFASIKGLPHSHVLEETETLLQQVHLSDAANVRSGSYSGGMKRRLSVAIALIGDPKIVFLDEPTTGMDPITRRSVWDIIEAAKPGRAIVLTTHSMEEADILGDRMAIMAKGRLRCLGNSIHLKNKFGSGYIVNVAVRSGSVNDLTSDSELERRAMNVKNFFAETLNIAPASESKAYIKFVVPRKYESQLPHVFASLKERKQELGVTDLQLSLTTLEEVFLNIARAAELEEAQREGKYETIFLANGMSLNVPLGATHVAVPGSATVDAPHGMMVELTWDQDANGGLTISHHSDLVPAPEEAAQLLGLESRTFSGRNQPVTGQVLELASRSMNS
eukprot:TRINITY_DN13562_c0_g1_i1.p1 TRINITY_DN13562_c0_g1~~TRINITY_DN13562_c0_g1_i1.p1  ORF type:complete len:960 (+),score=162.56 TRINITY_DN13562_c0_g1_i1:682-3561(+)